MTKWITLLVMLAATATAQPLPVVSGANGVIKLQPTEVDTFTCDLGITLTGKGTATAALRKTKQSDASPNALLTAHALASPATGVSITIDPDAGCGTSGCRAGNEYEIVLQPTDGTNEPICNLYLIVEKKYLTR